MDSKPTVHYEDCLKLDMRVGTIKSADTVLDSKKLLRLMVDFCAFERQVVAGIAKDYTDPVALVGKHAIFLINLEPRRLAGLESQAMILVAATDDHAVILQPSVPMPSGSSVQ